MQGEIHGPMLRRSARGIAAKAITALPVLPRSDGTSAKTPAAIGADVAQDVFHATTTEGALK
jgi:hypothetical protein